MSKGTQSPGYHIQPQIVDEEIGEACGGGAGVDIVKSELRDPITQAIRSQWESQDHPTF